MTAPPAPQSSKRLLSEAIYEQIMTDEDAPPSVRLEAAKAYDAIENGRPGVARPVNVDDVSDLDDDNFERLFHAVMRRMETRRPGFFEAMMRGSSIKYTGPAGGSSCPPKPKKFRVSARQAGRAPPCVPRWPSTPPAHRISAAVREVSLAAIAHTAPSTSALTAWSGCRRVPLRERSWGARQRRDLAGRRTGRARHRPLYLFEGGRTKAGAPQTCIEFAKQRSRPPGPLWSQIRLGRESRENQ